MSGKPPKKSKEPKEDISLDFASIGRILEAAGLEVPERYRVPDDRATPDQWAAVRKARSDLAFELKWSFTERYTVNNITEAAISERIKAATKIKLNAARISRALDSDEALRAGLDRRMPFRESALAFISGLLKAAKEEERHLVEINNERKEIERDMGAAGRQFTDFEKLGQPRLLYRLGCIFWQTFGSRPRIEYSGSSASGPFVQFVCAFHKEVGLSVPSPEALRQSWARSKFGQKSKK